MPNNLEKYLAGRRKDLDVETPDDQVIWKGISRDLQLKGNSRRRLRITKLRNIAAVGVIILCLGYMIHDVINDRLLVRNISLTQIDRILGEREEEYRTLVNYKVKEIESFDDTENIIITELLNEISNLDTVYQQSMADLIELGYNEKVINTIFDTYERKIYLLELIIIESNKGRKEGTDENTYL